MEQQVFASSELELFQVAVRVLFDDFSQIQEADAVYAFAETADNQDCVLETAALLHLEERARYVCISESSNSGYPGFGVWQKKLLFAKVPARYILAVPQWRCEYPPCTYTEARGLVILARDKGWEQIFIVAPPFHALRAFSDMVGAMNCFGVELKVYCLPGRAGSWQEEVVHSQGTLRGTRKFLLETEYERLQHYRSKGDLPSAGEVLQYLDWRDAQK